mmetsp:Transcript_54096/g.65310  ORF Transcript_54096/g.65310 Transcript_54096/m.65310 type:complete len:222 (+) Transcript_54096:808-1473(+)
MRWSFHDGEPCHLGRKLSNIFGPVHHRQIQIEQIPVGDNNRVHTVASSRDPGYGPSHTLPEGTSRFHHADWVPSNIAVPNQLHLRSTSLFQRRPRRTDTQEPDGRLKRSEPPSIIASHCGIDVLTQARVDFDPGNAEAARHDRCRLDASSERRRDDPCDVVRGQFRGRLGSKFTTSVRWIPAVVADRRVVWPRHFVGPYFFADFCKVHCSVVQALGMPHHD